MALTVEILKANAALSGLTDEQIKAITTLSLNDENSVIAKKTGEIYGGLDADILEVSGIPKNGTEKTFDYAKRVISEMKGNATKVAELQGQIETISKEKAKLEKAISEGATDAETSKALKQAKADLAAVQGEYNKLKEKHEEVEKTYQSELYGIRIDSAIQMATSNIKFKAGLPESATQVLLNQAIDKIKKLSPELVDDGNGGKTLVFKDDSGAIMRNPENQLNPYTPNDLLTKELKSMGILDEGRQGAGTGNKGETTTRNGGVVDISGAKTRVEAYEAITNTLVAQGLQIGTDKFDEAMSAAWKDNNIANLPEK